MAPFVDALAPAARATANFVEHKIKIHTFGPQNTSDAIEIALDQIAVLAAIAGQPEFAFEEGAVLESLEADLLIGEEAAESAIITEARGILSAKEMAGFEQHPRPETH